MKHIRYLYFAVQQDVEYAREKKRKSKSQLYFIYFYTLDDSNKLSVLFMKLPPTLLHN